MKKITKPKAKLPYKTGRNTKNTPDTRKELLDALKVGHTDKDSCILAGVGHDFFYSLIKKDTEFSEEVKKARLVAKDQCIKIIRSAATKTWTAAAWYLERKFKNEFSSRNEVTGANGESLMMTDEERAEAQRVFPNMNLKKENGDNNLRKD